MIGNDFSQKEAPQRARKSLPLILLIAVLLVIAGGGVLIWQLLSPQNSGANGNSHVVSPASPTQRAQSTTPQDPGQGKGTPSDVASDVRQAVSQNFNLSVSDLQAKLQSGTAIETLSTQQGMSQDQWHTFVLNTYQSAYDKEVSAGKVTQQRADHDMHNIKLYPLSALDDWVTGDCLGNSLAQ